MIVHLHECQLSGLELMILGDMNENGTEKLTDSYFNDEKQSSYLHQSTLGASLLVAMANEIYLEGGPCKLLMNKVEITATNTPIFTCWDHHRGKVHKLVSTLLGS